MGYICLVSFISQCRVILFRFRQLGNPSIPSPFVSAIKKTKHVLVVFALELDGANWWYDGFVLHR